MSKRKAAVKKNELVLKPYSDQSLTEWEHYALEYARLINAVHQMLVSEFEKQHPTDEEDEHHPIVTSGVVVLALKYPDTYRAVARNKGARETVKTINDASQAINDALGLSWGVRVNGGDNRGMFGVTLF